MPLIRYPPKSFTTKVYLDLGAIPAVNVKTVLSDALGNSLMQNRHQVVGDTLLEINLSALRPGMYLIRVESEHGYKTLKVIKQ